MFFRNIFVLVFSFLIVMGESRSFADGSKYIEYLRDITKYNVRPIRVLSLNGGGIRGLYTLSFLKELEIELGRPIHEVFDVFIGTSTGGIISLALANGKSIDECIKIYRDKGSSIFNKNIMRLIFTGNGYVLDQKYEAGPLEDILKENLQDKTLSQLEKPVLITTVKAQEGKKSELHIFNSFEHGSTLAVELGRMTSAAPTYFSPVKKEKDHDVVRYTDGGTHANDPVFVGYLKLSQQLGLTEETGNFFIVSIGTGIEIKTRPTSKIAALNGKNILMDAAFIEQSEAAQKVMTFIKKKGHDYFHFNQQLTQESELDDISQGNINYLQKTGKDYFYEDKEAYQLVTTLKYHLMKEDKKDYNPSVCVRECHGKNEYEREEYLKNLNPTKVARIKEMLIAVNAGDICKFFDLFYKHRNKLSESSIYLLRRMINLDKNLVNQRCAGGETPLMIASSKDDLKAVQFILESGADISIRNGNRGTALDYARDLNSFGRVYEFLKQRYLESGIFQSEILLKDGSRYLIRITGGSTDELYFRAKGVNEWTKLNLNLDRNQNGKYSMIPVMRGKTPDRVIPGVQIGNIYDENNLPSFAWLTPGTYEMPRMLYNGYAIPIDSSIASGFNYFSDPVLFSYKGDSYESKNFLILSGYKESGDSATFIQRLGYNRLFKIDTIYHPLLEHRVSETGVLRLIDQPSSTNRFDLNTLTVFSEDPGNSYEAIPLPKNDSRVSPSFAALGQMYEIKHRQSGGTVFILSGVAPKEMDLHEGSSFCANLGPKTDSNPLFNKTRIPRIHEWRVIFQANGQGKHSGLDLTRILDMNLSFWGWGNNLDFYSVYVPLQKMNPEPPHSELSVRCITRL